MLALLLSSCVGCKLPQLLSLDVLLCKMGLALGSQGEYVLSDAREAVK